MSVFEVKNLSLNIAGKDILSDISFSIEKGSFTCVIGPNGAGKSSLLSCLGRLNKNYFGEILLDGVSMASMNEKKIAQRIAWMHQSVNEGLAFSVREFAAMSRYPWHSSFSGQTEEDEIIVDDALKTAAVSGLANRKLNTLSGGERQRAMLAAALAQGTDILFLDEPTSFLDYKHQGELLSLVEKINRERSLTVVFVTHDINLALHGADNILAIKNGKLEWSGKADEMLCGNLLEKLYETDFARIKTEGSTHECVLARGLLE